MSTTCQTIVSRAQAFSPLNTGLTNDNAEMLTRIRSDQQALFGGPIAQHGDRFETTTTVTSTNAASGRTLDLSALTPPFQRVVSLTITSTGHRVRQVPSADLYAMAPPRYLQRGTTLTEVASDWGSTGAIGMTLAYVQGPTDIDPTGAITQTISIPDPWADLLILPLAYYLFTKDPGRNPQEGQELQTILGQRMAAFLLWLGGHESDGQPPEMGA